MAISRFGPGVRKLNHHGGCDLRLEMVGENKPGIPSQEPHIPAIVLLGQRRGMSQSRPVDFDPEKAMLGETLRQFDEVIPFPKADLDDEGPIDGKGCIEIKRLIVFEAKTELIPPFAEGSLLRLGDLALISQVARCPAAESVSFEVRHERENIDRIPS